MNAPTSTGKPFPLRPDPNVLTRAALRSVTRAAIHAARNAGQHAAVDHPWKDDRAIELLTRSSVAPTHISDAAALAQVRLHFLPSLVPTSAAAAVLTQTIQFSFDGATAISIPALSLPQAGWIGEAQAIPVVQGTSSIAATLTPFKLAVLIGLTREMVDGGDAETVMQQVLLENLGATLDAVFLNANAAVAGVSPAGILNGAIAVTPSPTGQNALAQDIGKLAAALGPVSGNSQPILICAPAQAATIKLVAFNPPPVFASNALADKTVVAVVPAAIASASGAPAISVSKETTLHMAAPASDLVSSPGTVAAPSRSLYQTDSLALRYTQDLTWAKRGNGVAMITGANWP
jgi:hypothetical protein